MRAHSPRQVIESFQPKETPFGARGSSEGFTLIEILVALVLLSLVSVALFTSVSASMRMTSAAESRAGETQQIRLVSEFIRSSLAAMVPVQSISAGKRVPHLEGSQDSLRFVTDTPARFRVGGLYEIKLESARADSKPVLRWSRHLLHPDLLDADGSPLAPRSAQRVVGTDSESESDAQGTSDERILVEDAELEFAYYGAPKREDTPRWYSEWQSDWAPPSRVKVSIVSETHGAWPAIVAQSRVAQVRLQRLTVTASAGQRAGSSDAEAAAEERDIFEDKEVSERGRAERETGLDCNLLGENLQGCKP